MSDEQIIEYLRSRARMEPPMGLTQRIMAEVETTPAGRSWFATFLPATASVAVIAVVAVVALLVFQAPPGVGPSASPAFPVATSDPRYAACGGPAFPDQVIAAFPFVAADYQRHFPLMGRSPELEVQQPAFAVVFAEGVPLPGLTGRLGASPPAPSGHMVCVFLGPPADGNTFNYVNVDITGMRVELDASEPPSPTPTASPTPAPTATPTPPPGYVAVENMAITVLANTEANALFARGVQTCVSGAGYTVEYPASWYTNAATADTPACTWFAPAPFEGSIRPVAVNPPPPDGVWVALHVIDGNAGYVGETPIYMTEQLSIGGYEGHRAEYGPSMGGVIGTPSEERGYWYVIPFASAGPTFIGSTSNTVADDYALAKAVLDRMMASIAFQPR